MEITINGTQVIITGDRIIGFALNNLVNRFEATIDKEEGWEYTLKAYMTKIDKINIINLNREGQTIYVDLTRDMMPVGGRYIMQFVATNEDKVDHTEKFEVWVEDSLDPNPQYDPVPSEFYQIEESIKQVYEDTKQLYNDIQNGNVFGDIEGIYGGNAFRTKN